MSAPATDRSGTLAAYERFPVGAAHVVALRDLAPAVREAIESGGTLYDYAAVQYAARQPGARELMGRAPAYALTLPGSAGDEGRVVVRHSRHGGVLAPLTGDRFLPPTRAPRELRTALRLARGGVATPELVAYAVYPAGPLLRRADVATREVAGAGDLAAVLSGAIDVCVNYTGQAARSVAIRAVGDLLESLARVGAHHPDLNAKNILLAPADAGPSPVAYVIDVDRMVFSAPGSPRVATANVRRLGRSLRKLRERRGLPITDDELVQLASAAGVHPVVAFTWWRR